MKRITRIASMIAVAAGVAGCVVAPAPVAYGPAPAYYYGPPVAVGVYGGWHYGWRRWG